VSNLDALGIGHDMLEGLARAARLLGTGRAAETLDAIEALGAGAQDLETVQLVRARADEDLDRFDRSWATLEKLLRREPDNAVFNLRAAVLLYRAGDLVRCEELLRRSWRTAPSPEGAYYLGRVLEARSHDDEARMFFVAAVAMEGRDGAWRAAAAARLGGD